MGISIYSFTEVRVDGQWRKFRSAVFPETMVKPTEEPFGYGHKGIFEFLGGVMKYMREYSHHNRGLPADSAYCHDFHGYVALSDAVGLLFFGGSWITLKELLMTDYSMHLKTPSGQTESLGIHLGQYFFDHLAVLSTLGGPEDVRVIFYFDN